MVRDTNDDLKEHLRRLEETIQSLAAKNTAVPAQDEVEWQAMLEEKESTQQGLRLCAQLSSQIDRMVSAQRPRPQAPQLPQAPKRPFAYQYIKDGLRVTSDSIQALVYKLQEHEAKIDRQMGAMSSTTPSSENVFVQLAQLQETKESIRQCIKVVSDADETADIERRNVFEDITMADEAYNFSVSTFGDLITARRMHLTGRSRNIGGQLTSIDYQVTVEALKSIDLKHQRSSQDGKEENNHGFPAPDAMEGGNHDSSAPGAKSGQEGTRGFSSRYGRGYQLPALQQGDQN